ncbi:MAG TPA: hypothetical protein VJR58_22880 [Vineibacter sp.]|nr:hypothetical protein [Vineibacter sp.]
MNRRWMRWSVGLAAMVLATSGAAAPPSEAWQACRRDPTRACVFAEAISRVRDDAPPGRDPQFAEWDQLLYLRLSEIAAAKKDRTLFDEAKRSAESNLIADSRRSALRWVAAAQARAGFADDAIKTLDDGDDGGFAAEAIALAQARAGQREAALAAVQRLTSRDAQIRALVRLARAARDARYLESAARVIQTLDDGYEQSASWPLLAIAHAELGALEPALEAVRRSAVSYHRAQALADIAALTHDPRRLIEARGYATGFDGRGHEDEVWAAVARAEIALGVLPGARTTLEAHLPRSPSRALAAAAGELAAAHWLGGDKQVAEKLIDELLVGSWTIGEARAVLARRLIAAGRFNEARQVSFLADEITFDNLSAEIALKQAEARAFDAALATADMIQHPARRSPTLAEIAAMLPP